MTRTHAPRTPWPDRLRGLPALVTAQVSLHSGLTGLRVAGPLMLLQAGAPAWQVGVMLAFVGLGSVAVAWPIGRQVDARGYRPPMAVAIGLAVAAALVGWSSGFADGTVRLALLCAATGLGGAAGAAGVVTLQRTAARMAPDQAALRSTFAWVGVAPSASNVTGPVAAGVMIDAVGPHGALLGLAGFPLLAWLVARVARPPGPPSPASRGQAATMAGVLRNPTVRRMMVVDMLITGGWDAHTFVVPTIGHARGLSATAIGTILAMFAAGVMAVRLSIPWVAHRVSERGVLTASLLATAAVFAVYPFGESAAFMAACGLALGMTIGIAQPMVMAALHQAVPDAQRGATIALRTMWVNGHGIALPIVLGAAIAALGANPLLWTISAAIGSGSLALRRRD